MYVGFAAEGTEDALAGRARRFHCQLAAIEGLEDVLEERLEPLGVPVLYKLPLGHGKHLATLPLGVTATLDADARSLTIDEPALRGATYNG